MKVHITNIYGQSYKSTALIAQDMTAKIAKQLGFEEMSIYNYPVDTDSESELNKRLDGIFAGFGNDDTLILQYPTWNGQKFDQKLVSKLKRYPKAKLIIFIHDIIALMFESNRYLLSSIIDLLNQADVLIMPSENMRKFLVRSGVRVKKTLIQEMWDHIYNYPDSIEPPYKKEITFIGNPDKFDFIKEWPYSSVRLRLYASKPSEFNARIDYVEPQPDVLLMPIMQKNGGFGLVWGEEPYWHEYMAHNTSYKLGTYLAAGVPVIIEQSNANAQSVQENNLGLVVKSLSEAVEKVQGTSEQEYRDLQKSVSSFSELLRQGYFTKHVLVDAIFYLLQSSKLAKDYELKDNNGVEFRIKTIEETLDLIIKNHACVSRFGAAETDLMRGKDIPYQTYTPELARKLRNIISIQSNQKFIVCLADVFENQDRYTDTAASFWHEHLEKNQEFYNEICTANWYGNSFISKFYMDFVDKSQSATYFEKIKNLWQKQEILIVEAGNTHSGVGNDLFLEAKSVKRIICPATDAYNKIDQIEEAIAKNAGDKLVLLMLGPTAKVIAADLAYQGMWIVDIGDIDSEYEWFKMKASHKVKLMRKHLAEYNSTEEVVLKENVEYESQIIMDLS